MEYTNSPYDLFEKHKSDLIPLEINGNTVYALKLKDEIGPYYAIPTVTSNLMPFPETLQGHVIIQIDYDTYCGKPAILKAYY